VSPLRKPTRVSSDYLHGGSAMKFWVKIKGTASADCTVKFDESFFYSDEGDWEAPPGKFLKSAGDYQWYQGPKVLAGYTGSGSGIKLIFNLYRFDKPPKVGATGSGDIQSHGSVSPLEDIGWEVTHVS